MSPEQATIYVGNSNLVQYTGNSSLFRFDTRCGRAPEPIVALPWRGAECTPAGPRRPNAFICTAFYYVSDIWMIENFDQRSP